MPVVASPAGTSAEGSPREAGTTRAAAAAAGGAGRVGFGSGGFWGAVGAVVVMGVVG